MARLILFLICLNITYTMVSQSPCPAEVGQYDIAGSLVDESGQKIDLANVLVLCPVDSSMIKGDLFMDGSFIITDIRIESILIKVTSLGYDPIHLTFSRGMSGDRFDIGPITMTNQMLAGVEIIPNEKIFETRGSDIIVNVENSSLSNAGTIMDVIRNAPKVSSGRGGQISVIGKGPAVLYLNGQQISSTQILSSLSSADVKSVEIIENPGAQYDASGQAVINVVTKTRSLEGYKINLLQEVGKGKHYRHYFKGDGYYKVNDWLFQVSYGYRPWSWGVRYNQNRNLTTENTLYATDNWNIQKHSKFDHDFTLRSLYQLNPRSTIGLQYTGTAQSGSNKAVNDRTFSTDGALLYKIHTDIEGYYSPSSHTANVFYQTSLDTIGTSVRISGQVSTFGFVRNESSNQALDNLNAIDRVERLGVNSNDIRIYTAQIDYNKPFSSQWVMAAGMKNAHIVNNNNFELNRLEPTGEAIPLSAFTSMDSYRENILALYEELTYSSSGLKVVTGMRTEWTKSTGLSTDLEGNIIGRNYFNIFPSISVSKKISDKSNATFGYNYRVGRPVFQDLNPYVIYVDALVSLQGNPDLVPEYSHNLSLGLQYTSWNLGVNYSYTRDKINQLFRSPDPEEPNRIVFIKENLDHTDLLSASLSYPINTKMYSASFTVGGFYDNHFIKDISRLTSNSKGGFFIQAWQSFKLPAGFKLDINYSYNSSKVDGVYTDNPISYMHVILSKSFLDNRLKIRLWGNDVLDKFKFRGTSQFNNMSMDYLSELDWHYVKLVCNWDFGKLSTKPLRDRKLSNAELSRINRSF